MGCGETKTERNDEKGKCIFLFSGRIYNSSTKDTIDHDITFSGKEKLDLLNDRTKSRGVHL